MERILFEDIKDAIKHYIIGRKTKQMLLKMELVFVSYERNFFETIRCCT